MIYPDKTDCREKGFTLIEILIAGTMLLMAILGASAIVSISMMSLTKSGEVSSALQLSTQHIEYLRDKTYVDINSSDSELAGMGTIGPTANGLGFILTEDINDDYDRTTTITCVDSVTLQDVAWNNDCDLKKIEVNTTESDEKEPDPTKKDSAFLDTYRVRTP